MVTKGDKVIIKQVPTEDRWYETETAKEEYLATVGKKGTVSYVVNSSPIRVIDVKFEGEEQVYSYEEHELEIENEAGI